MGDCQNRDLRVNFNRRLKLEFLGSKVTTDAGLLAYRELDEALGLTEMGAADVKDSRLGQNKQHGLLPLLRQSIFSRLATRIGEAALINRQNRRASPWQRRNMRFSGMRDGF